MLSLSERTSKAHETFRTSQARLDRRLQRQSRGLQSRSRAEPLPTSSLAQLARRSPCRRGRTHSLDLAARPAYLDFSFR